MLGSASNRSYKDTAEGVSARLYHQITNPTMINERQSRRPAIAEPGVTDALFGVAHSFFIVWTEGDDSGH